MRRFPSSWTRTLTALGFRRKRRSLAKSTQAGRLPRYESLERRELLSGTPLQPVPEYVLVDESGSDASTMFFVSTEYPGDQGSPLAVLKLRDDIAEDDFRTDLQRVSIELQLGAQVLERQEVLVDIAEETFQAAFLNDRLEAFEANRSNTERDTLESWVAALEDSGSFEDLEAGDLLTSVNRLGQIVATESETFGLLQTEQSRIYVYNGLRRVSEEAVQASVLGSGLTRELGEIATLTTALLVHDSEAGSQAVIDAGEAAATALQTVSDAYYTAFSGLEKNQVIAERVVGGMTYTIGFSEEASYSPHDQLRVELGDIDAMVQASIVGTPAPQFAALKQIATGVLQDVTFDESAGVAVDGLHLTVGPGVSDDRKDAVIDFSLASLGGSVPASSAIELTAVGGSFPASQQVAAHWDLWGLAGSPSDLTALTWDDYATSIIPGFGDSLDSWEASGGQTVVNVTAAVQRALLFGDSNLNGILDNSGPGGDVEAFYQSVTDWNGYKSSYGGAGVLTDGLVVRNDANGDGLVLNEPEALDESIDDVRWFFERMGVPRADFDLDGIVDGRDYGVWQENYGKQVDAFGKGDANFDGLVGYSDYGYWQDAEDDVASDPKEPRLRLQLSGESGGPVLYASNETSGSQPLLLTNLHPRAFVSAFDTSSGEFNLEYELADLSPDATWDGTLSIFQEIDGQRAAGPALWSQSLTHVGDGSHSLTIVDAIAIQDPDSSFTLVAEITSDQSAASSRYFDGGVFESADGSWQVHGGSGDDTFHFGATSISLSGDVSDSVSVGTAAIDIFTHLGGGNDIYTLDRLIDDDELVITDEAGIDSLSLPNASAGVPNGLVFSLTSPLRQRFLDGGGIRLANERAIDLATGHEIVQFAGPGYGSAPLVVDSVRDGVDGDFERNEFTLREALALADAIPGETTIRFSNSLFVHGNRTIHLANGSGSTRSRLPINSEVVIEGDDRLMLSGDGVTGVVYVAGGASLSMSDLTIAHGYTTGDGGGILSFGDTRLERVTLRDNRSVGSSAYVGGNGGALHVKDANLELIDSSVTGNSAAFGAGVSFRTWGGHSIDVSGSAIHHNRGVRAFGKGGHGALEIISWGGDRSAAYIESSTISNNTADRMGGALWVQGKVDATVVSSTVAENISDPLFPAGLWVQSGATVATHNSVFSDNIDENGSLRDVRGNVTGTYNLVRQQNGGSLLTNGVTGNISGSSVVSGLLPLAYYGGLTMSHGLAASSDAIDNGSNSKATEFGVTQDQRKGIRVLDEKLDGSYVVNIGSTEYVENSIAFASTGDTVINGTNSSDSIEIENDRYVINGVTLFVDIANATEVLVYAAGGDDDVQIAPDVLRSIRVYGGAGNDTLSSGGGYDYFSGGRGDDRLVFSGNESLGADYYSDVETLDFSSVDYGVGIDTYMRSDLTQVTQTSGVVANGRVATATSGTWTSTDGIQADFRATATTYIGTPYSDRFAGQYGDNTFVGGAGDDVYYHFNNPTAQQGVDKIVELTGEGSDTIDFTALANPQGFHFDIDLASSAGRHKVSNSYLFDLKWDMSERPELENVLLRSEGGQKATIRGNDLDNWLQGGLGADIITGGEGHDVITGGGGNDIIAGGGGNDTLDGGGGDDTYLYAGRNDQGTDSITEAADGGEDTIDFSNLEIHGGVSIDLSSTASDYAVAGQPQGPALYFDLSNSPQLENVVGTLFADLLIGNDLDNRIDGLQGSDIIRGAEGVDVLTGGAGDDLYQIVAGETAQTDTIDDASAQIANLAALLAADDFDGDGLAGAVESSVTLTDPLRRDTDGDYLLDGYEAAIAELDPLDYQDAILDLDGDGLINLEEVVAGTDPLNPDSDGDLVDDLIEADLHDTDNDGFSDTLEEWIGTSKWDSDSDSDGMPDYYEFGNNGLNPMVKDGDLDIDGDGISSLIEFKRGSVAWMFDTDGDGLDDLFEWSSELFNALVADDLSLDHDNDGLSTTDEITIHASRPDLADTDGDFMPDGFEILHSLDPLSPADSLTDYDGDGLLNLEEYVIGFSPTLANTDGTGPDDFVEALAAEGSSGGLLDTDNDGLADSVESSIGTDSNLADSDGDILPDAYELSAEGLSPLIKRDSFDDVDGDGLSNIDEYVHGSNPHSIDTDGNGVPDSAQVLIAHSDGDGLSDVVETLLGTDPLLFDTDGDGLGDGFEHQSLTLSPLAYLTNPPPAPATTGNGSAASASAIQPGDSTGDDDGDGLSNGHEQAYGTDPNSADTDGDGASDAAEVDGGGNPADSSDEGKKLSSENTVGILLHASGQALIDSGETARLGGDTEHTAYTQQPSTWSLTVGGATATNETKSVRVEAGKKHDLAKSHKGAGQFPTFFGGVGSVVPLLISDGVEEDYFNGGDFSNGSLWWSNDVLTSANINYISDGDSIISTDTDESPWHIVPEVHSVDDAKLVIPRVNVTVAGIGEDEEDTGSDSLSVSAKGLVKVTISAVTPDVSEFGGSVGVGVTGLELFLDEAGEQLAGDVSSLDPSSSHTFYAKATNYMGTRSVSAGYNRGNGSYGVLSVGDSVVVQQKATVIGIGGTGSAGWLNSSNAFTENGRWNSHVKNMVHFGWASHRTYLNGPSEGVLGSDSGNARYIAGLAVDNSVVFHPDNQIAILGWSRGATIALAVANDASAVGVEIAFVGQYDPVDMSAFIPTNPAGESIDTVVAIGPTPGGGNVDYPHFGRDTDNIAAENSAQTSVYQIFLDASHGALGGTPGYNDGAEDSSYDYAVDRRNSIEADHIMRRFMENRGFVVTSKPDHGFPIDNPSTQP